MTRARLLLLTAATGLALAAPPLRAGDIVLDWNQTIHDLMQSDGAKPIHSANPGYSTRSIAMMNTAIYDAFQAINRTHTPVLHTQLAPANTDLAAAVHQAAYEVLKDCYASEMTGPTGLQAIFDARMANVAPGVAKDNGIALGKAIAAECILNRTTPPDNSLPSAWQQYVIQDGPGKWRPQGQQQAWGPGWGTVRAFGVPQATLSSYVDQLPEIPALTSPEYTAAFDQVKAFGILNNSSRTPKMTDTGLFWAYDRPSMGPPPVLFIRNMKEIAEQIGSPAADNARLFAIASIAQADAAIAAWDAKFEDNFWRPIGAIQGDRLDGAKGHDDGNSNTAEDVTWVPLGAPDGTAGPSTNDFTPPFPAWVSGHATMGAAIFKTLDRFFGNSFAAADAQYPGDLETAMYTLYSAEFDGLGGTSGMTRSYAAFTENIDNWGLGKEGQETTPEGENAMSRVYLGVHWIFDQKDGTVLGRRIADYVFDNMFQPIPEPSSFALGALALVGLSRLSRKRSAA